MAHVQIYVIIFIISSIIFCVSYHNYHEELRRQHISGNYNSNIEFSLLGLVAAVISVANLGVIAANLFIFLLGAN